MNNPNQMYLFNYMEYDDYDSESYDQMFEQSEFNESEQTDSFIDECESMREDIYTNILDNIDINIENAMYGIQVALAEANSLKNHAHELAEDKQLISNNWQNKDMRWVRDK